MNAPDTCRNSWTTSSTSTSSIASSSSRNRRKILIVCDVQPDVIQKIPQPYRQRYVDLIKVAVHAARRSNDKENPKSSPSSCPTTIIHTLLRFDPPNYSQVSPHHPRLGVLRRLADAGNGTVKWFTSDSSAIGPMPTGDAASEDDEKREIIVTRSTFLPHANDGELMEVLRRHCCPEGDNAASSSCSVTLVGCQPTIQAMCSILGDVLAVPNIQLLKECIWKDNDGDVGGDGRQQQQLWTEVWLERGLLFNEQVVSLVDYLAETDMLHERMDCWDQEANNGPTKYVCDTGRGGHLCLFLPYLIRDYGFVEWPAQPWYKENSLTGKNKQFNCPLGRRIVDLCDEPKFSRSLRFFLFGRQHLDEKDLLYKLVPELMPPTFDAIDSAKAYAAEIAPTTTDGEGVDSQGEQASEKLLWFVKAVNQNGGRAVRITTALPLSLSSDEQLQLHVPRPLLYDGRFKCHVKTYQHILRSGSDNEWRVHMHDLFYLATASRPWSVDDLSDEAQITTMRTHRLYPDDAFRKRWNLTELLHSKMRILMERALQEGKLQDAVLPASDDNDKATTMTPQFEVNSADWMLDTDGEVYLIECNGIPVLYDPTSPKKQALVTKGLRLYDKLFQQDPETAVVNDTDLIREALHLAMTGKLPSTTLWKHVVTLPVLTSRLLL